MIFKDFHQLSYRMSQILHFSDSSSGLIHIEHFSQKFYIGYVVYLLHILCCSPIGNAKFDPWLMWGWPGLFTVKIYFPFVIYN